MRDDAAGADNSTSGDAATGALATGVCRDVAVGDAPIVGGRMVAGGSFANCRWASLSAHATTETTRRPTSSRASGVRLVGDRMSREPRRIRYGRAGTLAARARPEVVQITDVSRTSA